MTTICVDVMGADKEPEVLLKGVTCALEKDPDLCVLLAGLGRASWSPTAPPTSAPAPW